MLRKILATLAGTFIPIVTSLVFIIIFAATSMTPGETGNARVGAMMLGVLIPISITILLFYAFLSSLTEITYGRCVKYSIGFAAVISMFLLFGISGPLGAAEMLIAGFVAFVYFGICLSLATTVYWRIVHKPYRQTTMNDQPPAEE